MSIQEADATGDAKPDIRASLSKDSSPDQNEDRLDPSPSMVQGNKGELRPPPSKVQRRASTLRSPPRHFKLTWKSLRKAGESKYHFTPLDLCRRRAIGKLPDSSSQRRPPCATKGIQNDLKALSTPSLTEMSPRDILSSTGVGSSAFVLFDEAPHQPEEVRIATIDTYKYEVRVHKAMVVCDECLKSFIVQDFDSKHQCLKSHRYTQVSRCGKSFHGNPHWVYWCSCDHSRAVYIAALNIYIDDELEAVNSVYPECVHIAVVKELVEEEIDGVFAIGPDYDLTDHLYAKKETPHQMHNSKEEDDIINIGSEGAICVKIPSGCGVVYIWDHNLVCEFCKHQKNSCVHIKHITQLCQSDNISSILLPFSEHLNKGRPHTSLNQKIRYGLQSTKKVPFTFGDQLNRTLQQSHEDRFHITAGTCHLKEEVSTSCSICGITSWKDINHMPTKVSVITRNKVYPGLAYTIVCSTVDCQGKLVFDGQNNGLLSMKSFCVSYEILRHHMYQFLLGRTTIYTEYSILCEDHRDCGSNLSSTLTYQMYLAAWYGFISLLDIDYNTGFTCKICKFHPQVVVMDATTLSFRKELDVWKNLFKTEPTKSQIVDGRFRDRVAIPDVEGRRLLKAFADKGVSVEGFGRMKQIFQTCLPSIIPVLESASVSDTSCSLQKCTSKWVALLRSLSTTSPVCALIHPSGATEDLIDKMSREDITRDPATMAVLQKEIPVVHTLVQSLSFYPRVLLSPLLKNLLCRVRAPFLQIMHVESSLNEKCQADQLSYFPSLPKVRERQTYRADSKARDPICTKRTSRHPSLLPGVFTLFCEHGICYGFEVMRVCESPNTPFTILFERFEEAPRVVIYDNGCNLHQYMLNREPTFFQKTWVLVDRFHWPNHTGCSVGYQLDSYPQFSSINSQIVEQSNSTLKRIKPSKQ